jgi:hypothetical protein
MVRPKSRVRPSAARTPGGSGPRSVSNLVRKSQPV